MALVKCRECGKDISKEADACPHCGAKPKRTGCLTWAIGGFAAIVLISFIGKIGNTPTTTPPAAPAAQPDSGSTEKSVRSQTLVLLIKKGLRNPDSFKAESVIVTEAGAVCATYRAQNGFGGLNVEQAVLSADQTKALSGSETGFSALWNRECADKPGLETKYLYAH